MMSYMSEIAKIPSDFILWTSKYVGDYKIVIVFKGVAIPYTDT